MAYTTLTNTGAPSSYDQPPDSIGAAATQASQAQPALAYGGGGAPDMSSLAAGFGKPLYPTQGDDGGWMGAGSPMGLGSLYSSSPIQDWQKSGGGWGNPVATGAQQLGVWGSAQTPWAQGAQQSQAPSWSMAPWMRQGQQPQYPGRPPGWFPGSQAWNNDPWNQTINKRLGPNGPEFQDPASGQWQPDIAMHLMSGGYAPNVPNFAAPPAPMGSLYAGAPAAPYPVNPALANPANWYPSSRTF